LKETLVACLKQRTRSSYLLEVDEIALLVGLEHLRPSLFGGPIREMRWEDVETVGGALESLVAFLVAETADHRRLVGAVGCHMAFLRADAAGTEEWTIDTRIGALGLVVADFTAIEAFASHLLGFWALASHVAFVTAAKDYQRWVGCGWEIQNSLVASTTTEGTICVAVVAEARGIITKGCAAISASTPSIIYRNQNKDQLL
jgi:hypothetical protein